MWHPSHFASAIAGSVDGLIAPQPSRRRNNSALLLDRLGSITAAWIIARRVITGSAKGQLTKFVIVVKNRIQAANGVDAVLFRSICRTGLGLTCQVRLSQQGARRERFRYAGGRCRDPRLRPAHQTHRRHQVRFGHGQGGGRSPLPNLVRDL